jgi:hypothetical protein
LLLLLMLVLLQLMQLLLQGADLLLVSLPLVGES